MTADRGWKRPFDEPIPLPRGRQLVTLKDAAEYIQELPKAEQNLEERETAIGCLIGAAEGRDFVMHSRIGMLRALNHNVERTFTDRKQMHWDAGISRGTKNDSPIYVNTSKKVGDADHLQPETLVALDRRAQRRQRWPL